MGKLEKALLITLGVILAGLFIKSLVLHHHHTDDVITEHPHPQQIESYAKQFTAGEVYSDIGLTLDCSAFTKLIFNHFSISLPSTAAQQYNACTPVKNNELSGGNLVFFITSGQSVSHVGIYLYDNKFIHSPGVGKHIRIDSLTNSYYKNHFCCGGRINLAK